MESIFGFIVLLCILWVIKAIIEKPKQYRNSSTTENESNTPINFSMYYKKSTILTKTELAFYNQLKNAMSQLSVSICPQVNLERIINVKNNNNAYRNRIKSRSIDFAIISNTTSEVICCIELDDYTHNRKDRQVRDNFINELFSNVGIKLFHVNVASQYDFKEIENFISERI